MKKPTKEEGREIIISRGVVLSNDISMGLKEGIEKVATQKRRISPNMFPHETFTYLELKRGAYSKPSI